MTREWGRSATPAVGAADPQCIGKPWANKEKAGGCGLGFEVVFLVPLLARKRACSPPLESKC